MAQIVDLSRPNYQGQAIAQFLAQMAQRSAAEQRQKAELDATDKQNKQQRSAAVLEQLIKSGDFAGADQFIAANPDLGMSVPGGFSGVGQRLTDTATAQQAATAARRKQVAESMLSLVKPNMQPDPNGIGPTRPGEPVQRDATDPAGVRMMQMVDLWRQLPGNEGKSPSGDEMNMIRQSIQYASDPSQYGRATDIQSQIAPTGDQTVDNTLARDKFSQIEVPNSQSERALRAAQTNETNTLLPGKQISQTLSNAKGLKELSTVASGAGLDEKQTKVFMGFTKAAETKVAPLADKLIDLQLISDRLKDPQSAGFENYASMIQIMKGLDDSVVRSEEVKTALASLGITESLNAWLAKAEGGHLSPEFRRQLQSITIAAMAATRNKIADKMSGYQAQADIVDPSGRISGGLKTWIAARVKSGGNGFVPEDDVTPDKGP